MSIYTELKMPIACCPNCYETIYWEPGDDSIQKLEDIIKDIKRAQKNAKRDR